MRVLILIISILLTPDVYATTNCESIFQDNTRNNETNENKALTDRRKRLLLAKIDGVLKMSIKVGDVYVERYSVLLQANSKQEVDKIVMDLVGVIEIEGGRINVQRGGIIMASVTRSELENIIYYIPEVMDIYPNGEQPPPIYFKIPGRPGYRIPKLPNTDGIDTTKGVPELPNTDGIDTTKRVSKTTPGFKKWTQEQRLLKSGVFTKLQKLEVSNPLSRLAKKIAAKWNDNQISSGTTQLNAGTISVNSLPVTKERRTELSESVFKVLLSKKMKKPLEEVAPDTKLVTKLSALVNESLRENIVNELAESNDFSPNNKIGFRQFRKDLDSLLEMLGSPSDLKVLSTKANVVEDGESRNVYSYLIYNNKTGQAITLLLIQGYI